MPGSNTLEIGQQLLERSFTPDTVQLFLYNAAIWNAHRIHYDLPYAQHTEDHPGLLIDGPLQGDWLSQLVYDWMSDGHQLQAFKYSNRRAAYIGDVLVAKGEVIAIVNDEVALKLTLVNQHGQVTTAGEAIVSKRVQP